MPKDTKQLLANYELVPQNLIESIIKSNSTRKDVITNDIIEKTKFSGHLQINHERRFRQYSRIFSSRRNKRIKAKGIEVLVYEPSLKNDVFFNSSVESNFDIFLQKNAIS